MDWAEFDQRFAAAAEARGFHGQRVSSGHTAEILVWERGTQGPMVYLSAGMHGDEPAGPLALWEWMKSGAIDDGARWSVIPTLNPDGLRRGWRGNEDGVDLNRDFLTRTTREVSGHAGWLEHAPVPDLFLSLHEDWETEGFYLYEIRHGDDHPEVTTAALAAAQQVFALEPGPRIDGHDVREAGWIFHGVDPDEPEGWPEAIFLSRLGCPLSYTLETPSQMPLNRRVDCHLGVVNSLISSHLRNIFPKITR
jgi:murein peptide amidase A